MSLYKRENSPYWWAYINTPGRGRVRVSTGATDRKQAQRIHDELKAQHWSEPEVQSGARLSAAVLLWCQAENRGEPDIQSIRKFLRAYGDPPLAEAARDRDGIDRALRSFVTTPGNYTRHRARLSSVFNMAKDRGMIDTVPALRKWIAARKPPPQWVPQEKFPALLRELADHQRPMVIFAIHTGLRQSNLLNLKWSQVDLKKRIAWVHAIDTKANRTIRVPLNDIAISVLEGQLGLHPEYVFVYQGRPIKETKTAFMKACTRAGLGNMIFVANPDNKSGVSQTHT